MFECDGSERTESAIIFFSFELGYSRRPAAYLSNDVGHPASGLAFGHLVCNKESSASSRTSFTTCHQDGQKLAGYVQRRRGGHSSIGQILHVKEKSRLAGPEGAQFAVV